MLLAFISCSRLFIYGLNLRVPTSGARVAAYDISWFWWGVNIGTLSKIKKNAFSLSEFVIYWQFRIFCTNVPKLSCYINIFQTLHIQFRKRQTDQISIPALETTFKCKLQKCKVAYCAGYIYGLSTSKYFTLVNLMTCNTI